MKSVLLLGIVFVCYNFHRFNAESHFLCNVCKEVVNQNEEALKYLNERHSQLLQKMMIEIKSIANEKSNATNVCRSAK